MMGLQINQQHETTSTRREWLRSVTRWVMLGGLGVLAAVLVARRPNQSGSDDCGRRLPCRQCGLMAHCRRPRARDAREERSS